MVGRYGNVIVKNFYKKRKEEYYDKEEQFLLDFFSEPQSKLSAKIEDILSNEPSWPQIYHLSPQREFLYDWYPFLPEASLLEVGAGCGALTGMFCRNLKKVYANELTPERGQIIAKRYADMDNLEVLIGNISDLTLNTKVDYISVVGVLEYAGKYIEVENDTNVYSPYIKFLKRIKKFLNKRGKILLAIENKIGLKYLAGGKEDHYSTLYESIEGYPSYNGIRTFSLAELKKLFLASGLNVTNVFYPYPDYKLPSAVFTEAGFNTEMNIPVSWFAAVQDKANPPYHLFNELPLALSLKEEGILNLFANSFIIEATNI